MQKAKTKIIYSLKLHIALQQRGLRPLLEMRNPSNQALNCWVYERTPQFEKIFEELIGGWGT